MMADQERRRPAASVGRVVRSVAPSAPQRTRRLRLRDDIAEERENADRRLPEEPPIIQSG
jgi:hypothetical protein